ncbi:hypothetical protein HELRODRAFT_184893 [Helobdella robusta]|uniref:LanC-like protein 2 n=1 Tax=Helobdella robusta TaxID=6412 RepID=T1FM49_HELRO|nr:hypothetical protein HELRODRAFT_184893 [Helobdella robusta]ESO05814.1 hypothetical protein HELRODRAFT_184893 [Helobdella robusta]
MASSSKYSREFINSFPDYQESPSAHAAGTARLLRTSGSASAESYTDGKLDESLEARIRKQIQNLLAVLEVEYHIDWNDPSIYTGSSGVAYLYYHLYKNYDVDQKTKQAFLTKSVEIMKKTMKHIKNRAPSFIAGDAGPYCVGAIIFKADKKQDESEKCLKKFMDLFEKIDEDYDEPDEILYGKSGVLYALLFLRKHFGHERILDSMIMKLTKLILRSGQSRGQADGGEPPLMYQWHNKRYLGAAHGISGIIYMLLCVKDDPYIVKHMNDLIKPTIDYLITLKYPTGNFPSSLESSEDKLVQWCHGAPGWIYMLLSAHQIFDEPVYLRTAKECGKTTWERGLLKKGYGLCHGTAGNAYCFLALYNATENPKYLYRAIKFGEWCLDYGKHGARTPDRPFSLYEGMAGTIYFLADLLKPKEAKFPGFQV